ncbi:hypothetical protein KPL40_05875 [Clostridium gasigenes]|uniref:hypothetical protein n=1 Tax=Clostridium gasigenes TaxID=94869 RepID=UPI001C0D8B00|nr:hypothetical protein [Clostridium gasigenes]MBU3131974.1 hypothetical protein [Clostridium gasigenes]
MSYIYYKTFMLKDILKRSTVNFFHFASSIHSTEKEYNLICGRTINQKYITVTIYVDCLEFVILSQNSLEQKYVGIALRLFSQILVKNYGFLSICTNSNPRKLFITA